MNCRHLLIVLPMAACLTVMGCFDNTEPARTDPPEDATDVHHHHSHTPPNGGTPVVLGDEAYHVEFVLDASSGRMDAFILDGHMEDYIRVSLSQFDVRAESPEGDRFLQFLPVSNRATGETIGDTATFQARADWLTNVVEFNAEIVSVEIRSHRFERVPFHFPTGNER